MRLKGKQAISDMKIENIFSKSGSFEHEYAKFRFGEYYRKEGYWVTYEYKIGEGKTVDVVAEKDGKKIAIEIDTGKSDMIYNIKKDIDYGFDQIILIPLTKNIKNKIHDQLKEFGFDKVEKIEIINLTDLRF